MIGKHRVIILEGPDGGGKSTLARAFVRHFGAEVFHHGPYTGQPTIGHEYMKSLMHIESPVVLDRSWISEHVYGPIYRGVNRISKWEQRTLERVAWRRSAVIIYCMPSIATLDRVWHTRQRISNLVDPDAVDFTDTEYKRKTVWAAYRENFIPTDLPTTYYNHERDNIPRLMRIIEHVTGGCNATHSCLNESPGVGRWAPGKVSLILYDKIEYPPNSDIAFDLGYDGISMLRARFEDACKLEQNKQLLREGELYWFGIDDNTYYEDVVKLKQELNPPQIFMLGDRAEALVKYCGFIGIDDVRRI